MTYRFTNGEERWKIDPIESDRPSRWRLYHAVNEAWQQLSVFSTAEAAMSAVAAGQTGVEAWDAGPHNAADFAGDKWSLEHW